MRKSADEGTPLAGGSVKGDKLRPGGHTSVLGATAILATFSTTSSNVMFPRAYGVFGSLGGPLLGLALQGLMCVLTVLAVRIAVRFNCHTLGDLGRVLGGTWGGRVLSAGQLVNQAVFMPVALVLSADALKDVMLYAMRCTDATEAAPLDVGTCAWWACNVNPLWIILLFAWPVALLARNVGELAWSAYLSILLILVQTAAILYAAGSDDPKGDPAQLGPFLQLFGTTINPSWNLVIACLGAYLYSMCPLFIAVEVSASMQQPAKIEMAVILSTIFNTIVYVGTGLGVGLRWGAGMPNPITDMISGVPDAITNCILFYCTVLDFAICAAIVNREVQELWMPSFDRLCTLGNLPTWLIITLPSLIFALTLALLTPKLDSLTGLLESLCIPLVMLFGVPGMLLLLRSRRGRAVTLDAPDESVAREMAALEMVQGWEPALLAGVVLGIGLCIVLFAETVYSIATTDFSGRFFCDVVASGG